MKDLLYFSHDLNARNDSKLQKLRMKYGMEGLGIYWSLIEMLYENKNAIYINNDELSFIAFDLRVDDINKIKDIILNYNLFQNDGEIFWSESIGNRVEIIKSKSHKSRQSAYTKWGKNEDGKKTRAERLTEARKKGNHKKSEWEEMKSFFKNTCVKCNGETNLNGVVKDHIIPIYQGGSDGIENLQPLCAKCNTQKGPENIDYREKWCLQNTCEMPAKWVRNVCQKENKKETKEIEIKKTTKEITKPVFLNSNFDFILSKEDLLIFFNKTFSCIFSPIDFNKLIFLCSFDRVKDYIKYMVEYNKTNKIENPPGFLVKGVKEKWKIL